MAYLTIVSRTYNSATLRVDGLNTSSTYLEVSIWLSGYGSSSNLRTLPTRSNGQSNEWNVYGLSGSTTYYPQWSVRTASNSDSGSGSFTTPAAPSPPSTPSGFYASNSTINYGTVTLYWNASSGASVYNVQVYNGSGGYVTGGDTTGTSVTYNLSAGTYYYAYVSARNGNGSSGSAYTQWTTASPPYPSAPSSVSATASSTSYGQITVYFTPGSNATSYVITIRDAYGNYVTGSTVYSAYTNYNFSLSAGTYYQVAVSSANNYGTSGATWAYVTTTSPPLPSPVSYVSVTASTTVYGRLTVYFPSSANSSQYYVTVRLNNTSGAIVAQGYYSAAINLNFDLTQGATYVAGVTAYNPQGQASATTWSSAVATISEPKPSDITGVSVTTSTSSPPSVTVTWNAASYVVNYGVELYRSDGTYTGYRVDISANATRSYTFQTGLSEYTNYYVKIYGKNNVGNGNHTNSSTIRTGDFTDPSISISGISGLGSISLSWSASDSGSGLASTNRFLTYIGSQNGGQASLSSTGYTMSNSTSWTSDNSGKSLIAESTYWVGVRAYDAVGRSTVVSSSVTFKLTRPTNWDWATVKTSGGNFSLTAREWNDFTARINQFRLYKGLSQYSFTTVVAGNTILASQLNEAIIAIRAMATELTHQVSGGNATASFINSLKNTLNSIT